jgi:hypothetical protein
MAFFYQFPERLRDRYAGHIVMPMSELKCSIARREPGGEVGMRTGRIEAVGRG